MVSIQLFKTCAITLTIMVAVLLSAQQASRDPIDYLAPDKDLSESAERTVALASRRATEDNYAARADAMGVTVMYGSGTPELVCSPLRVCIIGLEEGEYIVSQGMHIGDQTRWLVTPTFGANNRTELIIKPIDAGLQTNLSIHTSRRTYIINLISRREDYVPYMSFRYPEITAALDPKERDQQWQKYYRQVNKTPAELPAPDPVEVKKPSDYVFDYRIGRCSGRDCRNFRPVRIFHDGSKTYIDLPEKFSGAYPLFVSSTAGLASTAETVESRWYGNRLVIDGIVAEGRLQRGKAFVSFVRITR